MEEPVIDRAIILEDLSRRLASSDELGEQAKLLRAIYLILPKVPETEPEWLEKLEIVSVLPNADDLAYLLRNMSDIHGIHLLKGRGINTTGIPVYVDNKNPNAIPISTYYIKRELTKIPDQFHADSATANGRLNSGYLGLPPEDFILDLFSIGIQYSGILPDGQNFLTAQQVWPFVASAISTQGTTRPFWFLVTKCDELPKLITFINKIEPIGNAYLRKRTGELRNGIEAIINNDKINDKKICKELKEAAKESMYSRGYFLKLLKRETESLEVLTEKLKVEFSKFINGSLPLGEVIVNLLKAGQLEEEEKYWIRQSISALNKYEDRNGLISIYNNSQYKAYQSKCRKLMRYIDYVENGPLF